MELVVELEQLSFAWGEGKPCLNIPELKVARGETLFIRGPSGSGKSTLLNLLGGVLKPSEGGISVLGCDYATLNATALDRFRADHIGFVFQQFNLLPYLSVIENVCLTCHFSPQRRKQVLADHASTEEGAIQLLDRLGLTDRALYERRVNELSVGQQQRVSVARALLGSPEIIIADEPTSALDADTRDQFLSLLLSQCSLMESTLIFVSHDSGLEHHFSRVVSFNNDGDGGFSL